MANQEKLKQALYHAQQINLLLDKAYDAHVAKLSTQKAA